MEKNWLYQVPRRIRFVPTNRYAKRHIPPPSPAKTAVPDWYRAGEMAVSKLDGKVASPSDDNISGGMKSCIPFLDAMISGYFITSWENYYVRTTDVVEEFYPIEMNPYTDKFEKFESPGPPMIKERDGDIGHTMPRPAGYCRNHMILAGQWGFRLPRGWSATITHPMNRFDLPFITSSGIIDADEWWTGGNIPFFFQKNFEGVIPSGTPFAQIVPIKRSSWISYISEISESRNNYVAEKARSISMGWYRQNIWVKKNYD